MTVFIPVAMLHPVTVVTPCDYFTTRDSGQPWGYGRLIALTAQVKGHYMTMVAPCDGIVLVLVGGGGCPCCSCTLTSGPELITLLLVYRG